MIKSKISTVIKKKIHAKKNILDGFQIGVKNYSCAILKYTTNPYKV